MKTYYSIRKLKDWKRLENKGFQIIGFTSQGVSRIEGAAYRVPVGNYAIEFITLTPHHVKDNRWVFDVRFNHIPDEWKSLKEYYKRDNGQTVKFYANEETSFYGILPQKLIDFVLNHHFTKMILE